MGGRGDMSPPTFGQEGHNIFSAFHVTLLLEKFPQHKTRELIGKMSIIAGLSVDTAYTGKLNCRDC